MNKDFAHEDKIKLLSNPCFHCMLCFGASPLEHRERAIVNEGFIVFDALAFALKRIVPTFVKLQDFSNELPNTLDSHSQ
jgi:hypothetical protein